MEEEREETMSLCGIGVLPAQTNKDKPSCSEEDIVRITN